MWILWTTPYILLFPAPESSCLKNKISVHQTRVWNYFFKAQPQSTNRSLQDLWNSMYVPLLHLCTVFTSGKVLHFHPYRPLYSANSIFRNKCLISFRKIFPDVFRENLWLLSLSMFAWSISGYLSSSLIQFSQFSLSVMSDSLRPHGLQHTRPPCSSPTPGVHPNSCPLSQWCHLTTSSSVVPYFCPQSVPASGSFQMSWLFASGGQSIGICPIRLYPLQCLAHDRCSKDVDVLKLLFIYFIYVWLCRVFAAAWAFL